MTHRFILIGLASVIALCGAFAMEVEFRHVGRICYGIAGLLTALAFFIP